MLPRWHWQSSEWSASVLLLGITAFTCLIVVPNVFRNSPGNNAAAFNVATTKFSADGGVNTVQRESTNSALEDDAASAGWSAATRAVWTSASLPYVQFALYLVGCAVLLRSTAMGRQCPSPLPPAGSTVPPCCPLQGKHAIVTGATRGIGYETAKQLALWGACVVVTGRSEAEMQAAAGRINAAVQQRTGGCCAAPVGVPPAAAAAASATQKSHSGCAVVVRPLDLADLLSVVAFAETYRGTAKPLDLLINNAGVMNVRTFRRTASLTHPIEFNIGVNFLGPLLLTELLLPLLTTRFRSRVVNVTSCAHMRTFDRLEPARQLSALHRVAAFMDRNKRSNTPASPPRPDPPVLFASNPRGVYGLSKLCQLYATRVRADQLRKTSATTRVAAVHPGITMSDLHEFPHWLEFLGPLGKPALRIASLLVCKTPRECAQNVLYAAVSPDVPQEGYVVECRDYGRASGVTCLSQWALDGVQAQAVYDWALEQLRPFLES